MSVKAEPKTDTAIGVVAAAPWRVTAMSVLPGRRLAVTFRDGTSGVVDLSGVCADPSKGIFATLADSNIFDQATIELGAVTWPNGADLDPHWMYEEIRAAPDKTWFVPI